MIPALSGSGASRPRQNRNTEGHGIHKEGDQTFTFLIALFDELTWLRAALAHLLQIGFQPDDLYLVARPDAFDGHLNDDWNEKSARANGGKLTRLYRPATMHDERPPPSGLTHKIQNRVLDFRDWLVPGFTTKLERELGHGASVLFVSVLDENKVADGCQALLSYTNRDVQTHELKLD